MSYAAFCVIWLGFLVGQTEGCIQQWTGLWIIYLPGHSERTNSKVGKALCGLDSSWPMPQAPWPNRVTALALQPISSACCTLCSNIAELHSFQVLLAAFPVIQCQEIYSAVGQAMTQPPCLSGGRPGSRAGKCLFEDPNLTDLHLIKYPGQDCANDLVLKRSKKPLVGTTTWVLQVGIQSAKVRLLVVASSFPFSIIIRFPVFKSLRFSCSSHGVRPEWGLPESNPQHWGHWISILGFLFPLLEL